LEDKNINKEGKRNRPEKGNVTSEPTSLSPIPRSKLANHVSIHLFNYVHKQITSFAGNESSISFLNHVRNTFSPGKLILDSVCSFALDIVRSDIVQAVYDTLFSNSTIIVLIYCCFGPKRHRPERSSYHLTSSIRLLINIEKSTSK